MNQEDLVRMRREGKLSDQEYLLALEMLHKKERAQVQANPETVRRNILFSIAILGIFSVLMGIGLIVAANWSDIPKVIKVSFGLGMLVLSLFGIPYFQNKNKTQWSEAFLFISFMLIGGNIALIQQSYHLSISWVSGSFLWWILSLPLVFITKYRLLSCCSIALLCFWTWDYIWKINYMLTVGILFIAMMLTHFFENKTMSFLRKLIFTIAVFILYVGDLGFSNGVAIAGVISTTLFLLFALNIPKNELKIVRCYNLLFIFVAWRIFLLFWTAYYNLSDIGILLVVFGTILLAGVGLYYYYFNQIQQAIQKLVIHKNELIEK